MDNIKTEIEAMMGGAQNAPQPPRSLVPYLMTANEILRADIPEKSSWFPLSCLHQVLEWFMRLEGSENLGLVWA